MKAKELLLETHCFAWDEGAVCKEIADFFYPVSVVEKENILKICREIQINGITTIATDLPVPTISYVAEQLGLTANSFESSLICTNKWMMRRALQESGTRVPLFFHSDNFSQNSIEKLKFPLIVKPTDRSGSRGVSKIDSEEDFALALNYAIENSIEKKAIIEEFIHGSEVSVETISWKGDHYVIAVTDKVTTGAPFFVEIAHHQPSQISDTLLVEIKKVTFNALNILGVKFGASHTELKIDSNGDIYVIEVGGRMGGDFIGSHLVNLSTGYDYVKGCIEVALGEFTPPKIEKSQFSGVFFLCDETRQLLPFFEKENHFDYIKESQSCDLRKVTNSNDRSGYLIYQSDSKIELF